jgi:ribosomal protein L31
LYSEDKDVRVGVRVTDGMKELLEDLKVEHWSFMHPSYQNKQNVMDAVHQIGD